MQDSETGEIFFGNYLRNGMIYDEETGEPKCFSQDPTSSFDNETGEPDCNLIKLRFQKTKFNVPKKYLDPPAEEPPVKCVLRDSNETFTLSDRKQVIHLKEEIILGYNKTSHRMFLIPSLFLFFKLTALFIATSELILHIWAHRKNARNTNQNVYYRSPLHVLTSQFCAVCRSQHDYDHINRLQDKKRQLHENLKRVSQSFS